MRNLSKYLENRSINYDKLLNYGFIKKEDNYIYESNICDNFFKIIVEISKEKQISKVIDLEVNDEYVLIDVNDSFGEFIGKIKEEYEKKLNDIIEKCTTLNIFKSREAKEIIKYVKEKYDDDLEFLWEKFSNNAIWRNKENNKWYGLLVVLPENKLGKEGNKKIEIIDLRYQKENVKEIIDNEKFFEGYHMNKNNWITIVLDGSVSLKEIYKLIDNSYELSLKRK